MPARRWTPEDDRWLAAVYHLMPLHQIAARLGRTSKATKFRANTVLGLSLNVPGYYKVPQVAQALGLTETTVREYIALGRIKATGKGRRALVRRAELERATLTLRRKTPLDGWISNAEAQRVLGYSASNITKLCAHKALRAYKLHSKWWIDSAHVAKLAAAMRASGGGRLDWGRLSPEMAQYSAVQAAKTRARHRLKKEAKRAH